MKLTSERRDLLIMLCQELIQRQSYSGHEDGVVELMRQAFAELKFDKVLTDEYGSVLGRVKGKHPGKVLLLDGHIDTVPVPDESKWTHRPYGGEVADGKIYGRGASDMKGAVSAMVAASAFFAADTEREFAGEIYVSGVVHEECFEGIAARKISERIKPDYVVIGESSELNLKRGQRGRAELVVETFGKPAHSANPRAGVNAVYKMAALIGEIGKLNPPLHEILGEGILEVTDIKSSPYPGASVVPDFCRATYDRRLLVGETRESVLKPLQALIDAMKNKDAEFDARVCFASGTEKCYTGTEIHGERFFPGWVFETGDEFVQLALAGLRSAGLEPQVTQYSFCTNGSHYAGEAGIKTIGFGPSRENLAHTIDEYIEIDQLVKAAEGYYGILVVEDDLIAAIGTDHESGMFDRTIDAEGLIVAPGFIDTHSHSDLEVMVNPYIEAKIRQGVTTELLGQDGISMAPLPKRYISPWRKNLAGLDGDSDELGWDYETTDGYLKALEEKGVGLNESYLIPHGNVRMEAMGLDNRKPAQQELESMRQIVRREMEAGAFGLSTGLIYMPCAYAETAELIELCRVVEEFDGAFVVHQRSEADTILASMEEVIEIGRRSGVKIHFSHFKICGRKNWTLIDKVLGLLDKAAAEGIRTSFDQYPYVAGSTMLSAILPPWAHDGGTDKLMERLRSSGLRERMTRDIECGIPGWDNFVDFAGTDQIFVTSVKSEANQDLVGKSLAEIGAIRNKQPLSAAFDLLLAEENAVGMVDFYGKEEHVVRFLTRPEQNVCTDGLLGGRPHPRVFGSFPRVLGKYVREEKALTLEDAVRKMTQKPSEVFGFKGRGLLKVGNFADIVIFNPETIIDNGTFVDPIQFPSGIQHVLINGKVVLSEGTCCSELAGKVLRKHIAR